MISHALLEKDMTYQPLRVFIYMFILLNQLSISYNIFNKNTYLLDIRDFLFMNDKSMKWTVMFTSTSIKAIFC
jgi:hypothetical protein